MLDRITNTFNKKVKAHSDHVENAAGADQSPSSSSESSEKVADNNNNPPEESIEDYYYLDKPFYRYKFLNILNWYIFLNTISSTSS
ncbi:hypothetical protein G210_4446, partial [Candida maltosa Xu316]